MTMNKIHLPISIVLIAIVFSFLLGCGGGGGGGGSPVGPTQPTVNPVNIAAFQATLNKNDSTWVPGNTGVTLSLQPSEYKLLCGDSEQNLNSPSNAIRQSNASAKNIFSATLPQDFSWRSYQGKNWLTSEKGQGSYGTCVAFACCACLESLIKIKENRPNDDIDLSEYYLWSKGLNLNPKRGLTEGSAAWGWFLTGGSNTLIKFGTVEEQYCPYSQITNWPEYSVLSSNANVYKIKDFRWAYGADEMKQALLNGPIVSKMTVYTDFLYLRTGIYNKPLPIGSQLYEGSNILQAKEGMHAILIVGYDDNKKAWLIKNSWKTSMGSWGDNGFGWIHYDAGVLADWGGEYVYESQPINTATGTNTGTNTGLATGTGSASSVPAGVTATPGDGKVTIAWNPVSGASSYKIYWLPENVLFPTPTLTKTNGRPITVGNAPSYIHTGLANGTTYYYIVTAINSAGESNPSSPTVYAKPFSGGTNTGTISGTSTGIGILTKMCNYEVIESTGVFLTDSFKPGTKFQGRVRLSQESIQEVDTINTNVPIVWTGNSFSGKVKDDIVGEITYSGILINSTEFEGERFVKLSSTIYHKAKFTSRNPTSTSTGSSTGTTTGTTTTSKFGTYSVTAKTIDTNTTYNPIGKTSTGSIILSSPSSISGTIFEKSFVGTWSGDTISWSAETPVVFNPPLAEKYVMQKDVISLTVTGTKLTGTYKSTITTYKKSDNSVDSSVPVGYVTVSLSGTKN